MHKQLQMDFNPAHDVSSESEPLTLDQLEAHLWEAANILRGPVDAADFKSYIFPLLFFKRISDVYDEEFRAALQESDGDLEYASFAEHHRFQVPAGHHWNDVHSTPQNVGFALQNALRHIEQANPETLHGIFGDARWSNKERLSDALLHKLLDHFHRIRLDNQSVQADVMGNAYEYLIKKFADGANKAAGEFYTPRLVVRLMVNILDPQPKESIYDPACGTGGMLLEAIQHLRNRHQEYRNLRIRGEEKNLTTQSIARMNLFLHGVEDFEIARGDTLRDPHFHRGDRLERFDCVLANPPFSLKKWGADQWANDPYDRHRLGLPTDSSGDFAWIMHMLQSTADQGRMAVVMSQGALFRGGKEGKIRQALLEQDLFDAVISLGPNLFYGTGIPACILVLRPHKPASHQGEVLMVNASDIFTKDRAQNHLTEAQADAIYALVAARENKEGLARRVTLQEIADNDYNLNMTRYVYPEVEDTTPPVAVALADFQQALTEMNQADEALETLLKQAGYDL